MKSYMYIRIHVKCPLFLSDFNDNLIFSVDFRKKKLKYEIPYKSVSRSRVAPCGRKDMMQLIVAFRNFTNAPENNTKCIET